MAVSTISGAIKWTGLASDTDFGRVVQQLVAIEQRTITRQQKWKSEWVNKLAAINGLDTRLSALKMDAQGYSKREDLLSRAAVSSDEKVATITNLSTAPPGIYDVEVGSNIREKFASGSYEAGKPIGLKLSKGLTGALVGADGKPFIKPGGTNYELDVNGYPVDASNQPRLDLLYYTNEAGNIIDSEGRLLTAEGYINADGQHIERESGDVLDEFDLDENGYPTDKVTKKIRYDLLAPLPAGVEPPPLTITMGGKTLSLEFDPLAEPGTPGVYNGSFTLAGLADSINAAAEEPGYNGPKVSAEVVIDKTRSGKTYSRLVITGGEGGSANSITVSDPDPTNLGLGQKRFDEPMLTSLLGTTARPKIAEGSVYTGHSNKSILFVPTTTGVLGQNDITISWHDTEGNRGTFTIKADDWANGKRDDIEILQGLKINFDFGTMGNFIANEAFTIDCQVPVMQQAADSGMAATDKWIHQGWPDQTSPVTFGGPGRFDFSYAGENYSVNISDGLGLSGLAEAINKYAKNPGVIASIINDGMGTATSYKLVLTGAHTGVEHGIEILSTTNLNRMSCKPENFEQARRASNSMTRFDGYPNDGSSWLQRSTNEVSDVIEGTVVNLMGIGKTTITIKNNVTEMINKIKALVQSVNSTKGFIKEHTKWGGGKLVSNVLSDGSLERSTEGGEANGIMIGNYGFQISLSEIDKLMTRPIFSVNDFIEARYPDAPERARISLERKHELYNEYLEANGLAYTRLSDIGIISNPELQGAYVIEESKLSECLSRNPDAVIKLFTFVNGETDFPVGNTVVTHLDEAPRPRLQGFALQLGFRMSDLTRVNDVIDPATGQIVKPAKGITKVLAENYNNIISGSDGKGGIDAKIARETKRIEQYQQRLEQKFSRLEAALAQLNGTSERVSSQLAQLNKSSS